MRTIRRQLLLWLLGGVLACTLAAGLATYLKVREETSELFDYQLREIAASLPPDFPPGCGSRASTKPKRTS